MGDAARETTDGRYRYKSTTFGVWLAAIGDRHLRQRLPSPCTDPLVTTLMAEIRERRAADGESARSTPPLLAADLRAVVTSIDEGAHGWVAQVAARRDIALLVLGFSGALRTGELARLAVRDVTTVERLDEQWLAVRLGKPGSGRGEPDFVYLPRGLTSARWCPWCAYLRWLAVIAAYDTAVDRVVKREKERECDGAVVDWTAVPVTAADAGALAVTRLVRGGPAAPDEHVCHGSWPRVPQITAPLFRSLRNGTPREKQALTGGSISRMLKRRATQAGLDTATVASLSAHAIRAGAATEAFARGASLDEVMALTRHKSADAVRRYDRASSAGTTAAALLRL
ncbi:hypothetical protein [Nocardia sp. NPDC046763]|uniref:hypothetical protein n=1 Tax=Nocardia sp. NPDC046763 TaxID=3155256 RepID=UPI0033E83C7F